MESLQFSFITLFTYGLFPEIENTLYGGENRKVQCEPYNGEQVQHYKVNSKLLRFLGAILRRLNAQDVTKSECWILEVGRLETHLFSGASFLHKTLHPETTVNKALFVQAQ